MNIGVLGDGVTAKAVKAKIEELEGYNITSLDNADLIVASPGIPPEQFPKTDTPVISEIELAYRLFKLRLQPHPVFIGITGTNGKTTITSLLGHILQCPVAGNIGKPLISFVPSSKDKSPLPKYLAIELSSYQLETTLTFKPHVAIVTNITEDHLQRHKTMELYALAKARIFGNQDQNDLLIYNYTDPYTAKTAASCASRIITFDAEHDPLGIKDHIKIPGQHNFENASMAALAADFLHIPIDVIKDRIAGFNGVEHRIEYVASIGDLAFYNDSKATNPDSTITALRALGPNGILILGGRDKMTSLHSMSAYIKDNISHVILIGEATQRFEEALRKDRIVNIHKEDDMYGAVEKALMIRREEKYILLSPACASFDMYANFEERGRHFKQIVKDLVTKDE